MPLFKGKKKPLPIPTPAPVTPVQGVELTPQTPQEAAKATEQEQKTNELIQSLATYNEFVTPQDVANMSDPSLRSLDLNLKFAIFAKLSEIVELAKE